MHPRIQAQCVKCRSSAWRPECDAYLSDDGSRNRRAEDGHADRLCRDKVLATECTQGLTLQAWQPVMADVLSHIQAPSMRDVRAQRSVIAKYDRMRSTPPMSEHPAVRATYWRLFSPNQKQPSIELVQHEWGTHGQPETECWRRKAAGEERACAERRDVTRRRDGVALVRDVKIAPSLRAMILQP